MNWGALNLQVIWVGRTRLTAPDLFKQAVGVEPQSSTTMQLGTGKSTGANGIVESYVLGFSTQPGRVDLTVSPADNQSLEALSTPPVFETIEPVIRRLRELIGEVRVELTNRIGFVVNLVQFVDSFEEVSAILLKEVNIHLPFGDALDVTFKVSRRMLLSEPQGVTLNRVLTWQPQVFQRLRVQAGGLDGSGMIPLPLVSQQHAATINIDVNNVPDPKRGFTHVEICTMFSRMSDEMLRLARSPTPATLA